MGFALLGAAACSLDPVGGGTPLPDGSVVVPGDPVQRIPNLEDPAADQRLDDLGIICETTLALNGTWVESEPQPPDLNGCWPVGEWRFTTSVVRVGCDPQEPIDAQEFVYQVDRVDDSHVVTYLASPTDPRVNFKISTNGSGVCAAGFEHYGLDLRVLDFKPNLLPGETTLSGEGYFQVWLEDPF
jgi:hypothetical protein